MREKALQCGKHAMGTQGVEAKWEIEGLGRIWEGHLTCSRRWAPPCTATQMPANYHQRLTNTFTIHGRQRAADTERMPDRNMADA